MIDDKLKSAAEKAVNMLIEKNISISTAESCTGGLIAKCITDISGASAVFSSGVVTYSNEMKTKLLGVEGDLFPKYGAVSECVALQMAHGSRCLANSDIAISVTGIAGPNSDGTGKPVGLCFIGFSDKSGDYVIKLQSDSSLCRDEIRKNTAYHAFLAVLYYLDHDNKFDSESFSECYLK